MAREMFGATGGVREILRKTTFTMHASNIILQRVQSNSPNDD